MTFDASVWKRQTHTLTLSKGEVEVQKLDIAALVMSDDSGDVPDSLSQLVLDGFDPSKNGSKKKDAWKPSKEDLPRLNRFINRVIRAAMVVPRIVENPVYANGEIHIDDLDMNDKIIVFEWAMAMPTQEVRASETFPAKQA